MDADTCHVRDGTSIVYGPTPVKTRILGGYTGQVQHRDDLAAHINVRNPHTVVAEQRLLVAFPGKRWQRPALALALKRNAPSWLDRLLVERLSQAWWRLWTQKQTVPFYVRRLTRATAIKNMLENNRVSNAKFFTVG